MFAFLDRRRNRRQDRTFQLDVKIRAEVAQRNRRRSGLRFLASLAGLVLLVAGTAAGVAFARHQWLYRMDALALRQLSAVTDGVLTEREILAQAGLRPGLNTFALDLPAVQARLRRHPRIASAEVHRELPDKVRLVIRERFPVARVKPSANAPLDFFYLLDETGHVLLPLPRDPATQETAEVEAFLPLLIGVSSVPFTVNAPVHDPQILGALRFLAAFENSLMAGLTELVSVDVSRPGELEVLTSLGGRVNFGLREGDPRFDQQLPAWAAVHQDGVGRGRLIGTLDLSVTNNAPLRWLDSSLPTLEAPRLTKPKRKPVRRHV
jgi:hypothetical protein